MRNSWVMKWGPTIAAYCDPYDQFGQLSYEMWRALRLVVDTGLHAKGWSREKAVEFMLANSSMSSHNAQAEVDRYVAWPGQALAYKVGELTINRLRGEASAALGSRFDLRAFHDEVLSRGALPLSLLESYVQQWVTTQETKVVGLLIDGRLVHWGQHHPESGCSDTEESQANLIDTEPLSAISETHCTKDVERGQSRYPASSAGNNPVCDTERTTVRRARIAAGATTIIQC